MSTCRSRSFPFLFSYFACAYRASMQLKYDSFEHMLATRKLRMRTHGSADCPTVLIRPLSFAKPSSSS
jgi:hypothetical protein